ncbi:hypothetical protein PEPNEM18_00828 [Aedoeadaptatus nemausensis]|uniref:Uncharacterized protein n=1 Tax=Aedoeadaptatus nemausensis TaxID=2582829 RepID=A0A6V6Y219_9FIRM|nr:hypothetical protein PEPNEM18_00828 [Peptoniphilus nemausensis]
MAKTMATKDNDYFAEATLSLVMSDCFGGLMHRMSQK